MRCRLLQRGFAGSLVGEAGFSLGPSEPGSCYRAAYNPLDSFS